MNSNPQNVFRALADPTRREVLMLLSERDRSIGDVAAEFDITRSAIQKHLNVLEEGGLISVEKRGRNSINQLEPQALKPVSDWLSYFDQFWDTRLANLAQAIENDTKKGKN